MPTLNLGLTIEQLTGIVAILGAFMLSTWIAILHILTYRGPSMVKRVDEVIEASRFRLDTEVSNAHVQISQYREAAGKIIKDYGNDQLRRVADVIEQQMNETGKEAERFIRDICTRVLKSEIERAAAQVKQTPRERIFDTLMEHASDFSWETSELIELLDAVADDGDTQTEPQDA